MSYPFDFDYLPMPEFNLFMFIYSVISAHYNAHMIRMGTLSYPLHLPLHWHRQSENFSLDVDGVEEGKRGVGREKATVKTKGKDGVMDNRGVFVGLKRCL